MPQTTIKTKVIFRKFNSGALIALFPEQLGTRQWNTCESYMHIGQHGSALIELVMITKLASPPEYSELKRELETLGYNLEVVQKFTNKHLQFRLNQIKN